MKPETEKKLEEIITLRKDNKNINDMLKTKGLKSKPIGRLPDDIINAVIALLEARRNVNEERIEKMLGGE